MFAMYAILGVILCVIVTFINYFIITTIVDWCLMGIAIPIFAKNCCSKMFFIEKKNRIDFQKNIECSAFSSAYILRHLNIDAAGEELYKIMPNKMKTGYVYPKGICNLLKQYGVKVKYRIGNLNSLKNEVRKGNPVIVMIKTEEDKKELHYVPVVGYDNNFIYVAESLKYLANIDEEKYNRKIENSKFKKLWKTNELKMPLYRNTYIAIRINH